MRAWRFLPSLSYSWVNFHFHLISNLTINYLRKVQLNMNIKAPLELCRDSGPAAPQTACSSIVVLAVLLSLLLRRLRQSRAVPERREGRGLMGRFTGKGEARADLSSICDTQLELMKMKTLGVVPSNMENSKMKVWGQG